MTFSTSRYNQLAKKSLKHDRENEPALTPKEDKEFGVLVQQSLQLMLMRQQNAFFNTKKLLMKKIQSFDKQTCRVLRDEIDAALKTIADKYSISLSIGNISFNAETFRTRLEAKVADAAPKPIVDFSDAFGYPPIGTEFTAQGRKFKVTGHKPSRPKYPIVGTEISTGKAYKFTVEAVTKNPFKGIGMI